MGDIFNLSVDEELIFKAEEELGVEFPDILKQIWKISNGLEFSGGWRLFPIFDPKDPRKTCNHIVYENTKARWDHMASNLISIVSSDTGNYLVL